MIAKTRVVEREKPQVTSGFVGHARPDAADRRSGSRAAGRAAAGAARARGPATAIAASTVPTAQIPSRPAPRRRSSPRRCRRRRARTPAARPVRRRRGTPSIETVFASQIALRSHGASSSPSSSRCSRSATNARVRPRSAVKTIATQSSPFAARSELPGRAARSGRRRARRRRRAASRGRRCARAELEPEVLARERERRRRSRRSYERQPLRGERLEPRRVVGRDHEGRVRP